MPSHQSRGGWHPLIPPKVAPFYAAANMRIPYRLHTLRIPLRSRGQLGMFLEQALRKVGFEGLHRRQQTEHKVLLLGKFRFARIWREWKSMRFRFLFEHGVNDFQQQRTGLARG